PYARIEHRRHAIVRVREEPRHARRRQHASRVEELRRRESLAQRIDLRRVGARGAHRYPPGTEPRQGIAPPSCSGKSSSSDEKSRSPRRKLESTLRKALTCQPPSFARQKSAAPGCRSIEPIPSQAL